LPGQKRPAMVCELTVTEQGEIENFSVANAFIESRPS